MAGSPLIFVNGDFLATLKNSGYGQAEVPSGSGEVSATVGLLEYGYFPPPTGDWASGVECSSMNWRRLAEVPRADVVGCLAELRDLFQRCGITVSRVGPLKITRIPHCNYKLHGADAAFNFADLAASRPKELQHESLRVEAEAGQTYYVKWSVSTSGGKMMLVDAATGAKEIRKLHAAKD